MFKFLLGERFSLALSVLSVLVLGQACATKTGACEPALCSGCCLEQACVARCPDALICGANGFCQSPSSTDSGQRDSGTVNTSDSGVDDDGGVDGGESCGPSSCTGCCVDATCFTGVDVDVTACGAGGAACVQCPDEHSCLGGACCARTGTTCGASDGCCNGIACTNGVCCQPEGASCSASTECCLGATCWNGACVVVTVSTLIGGSDAGSADSPDGSATFVSPTGLAADDAGYLYIGDRIVPGIRRLTLSTCAVKTFLGNSGVSSTLGTDGIAWSGVHTYNFSDRHLLAAEAARNRLVMYSEVASISPYSAFAAGNGVKGFADGYPPTYAIESKLATPTGIAAAPEGHFFVADKDNNRIRLFSSNTFVPLIGPYAGTGAQGWADGLAENAKFNHPQGVAVDAYGNVYVADTGNARIRKIDPLQNVSTLAGNGQVGFSDGTGGPDGTAQFSGPTGIAVDAAGNVYVLDTGNHAVRRIDAYGNVITLAGVGQPGFAEGVGGEAQFDTPTLGLQPLGLGKLAVADTNNHRVRLVSWDAGAWEAGDAGAQCLLSQCGDGGMCWNNVCQPIGVTTFAGNGDAGWVDGTGGRTGTTRFNYVTSMTFDDAGFLYAADGCRIRKLDAQGNTTTFAGNGTCTWADGTGGPTGTAQFAQLGAITQGGGTFYATDTYAHRIRKIDSAGNVTTLAGNGAQGVVNGTGGPSGTAQFDSPGDVAVDSAGNVFVTEGSARLIRKIDTSGNVTTFAGTGANGWVDGPRLSAQFNDPRTLAFGPNGTLYVAEFYRIRQIDTAGNVTTLVGNGPSASYDGTGGGGFGTASFSGVGAMAVDADGNLYVTDYRRVAKISPRGQVRTVLYSEAIFKWVDGTGGRYGTAQFGYIGGIAVDSTGGVFFGDTFFHVIRLAR